MNKKYIYKKENGVIPSDIVFQKGFIVTYLDYIEGKLTQKNIIILDRIREEARFDVFGSACLTLTRHDPPVIELADPKSELSKEWSRVWHNRDVIRPATNYEMMQLANALYQIAGTGETIMEVELPGHNHISDKE